MPVMKVSGTQTGRFSSNSPNFSDVAEAMDRETKRRHDRLELGFRVGMQREICSKCSLSLACASHAVFDIFRCMTCRTTHVYLVMENPMTRMLSVALSAGVCCQAATHNNHHYTCTECNNSTESNGYYQPWAQKR